MLTCVRWYVAYLLSLRHVEAIPSYSAKTQLIWIGVVEFI